jgi:hypothetical protein
MFTSSQPALRKLLDNDQGVRYRSGSAGSDHRNVKVEQCGSRQNPKERLDKRPSCTLGNISKIHGNS